MYEKLPESWLFYSDTCYKYVKIYFNTVVYTFSLLSVWLCITSTDLKIILEYSSMLIMFCH